MGFIDSALLRMGLERRSGAPSPKDRAVRPQRPATKTDSAGFDSRPALNPADLAQQIASLQDQLSKLALIAAESTSATTQEVLSAQSELVRRTLALRRQERRQAGSAREHAGG